MTAERIANLDMINDDELAAYLTTRGWQTTILPDPTNTQQRHLLLSPWRHAGKPETVEAS